MNTKSFFTGCVVAFLALGLAVPAGAQTRDLDYDWIMSTIDVLLQDFAPGFSYPLAGMDNDSNGIDEEDTLAMLSSVVRGGTRVTGLDSTMVSQITADFASNRSAMDNDLRVEGTGFLGDCWLLGVLGYPCKLTDILKMDMALGSDHGAWVSELLLDFLGGLATVGDNPATFTFMNAYISALIDAFGSSLESSVQQYVDRIRDDLEVHASNYYRWGDGNSGSPRRNAFGPNGNLDWNQDSTTNLNEYASAGTNRETFLTNNAVTPPIHITGQPVGCNKLTGETHLMTVGFVGGSSPFTYLWENADDFPGENDDPTFGLVPISNGNGISGATSQSLSFDYLLPAHNGLKPWVHVSDPITVHNPANPAGSPPSGSYEDDARGGRTSLFREINVSVQTFQITPQPVGTSLTVGDGYTMTSGAVGGSSLPSYQWYKDSSAISGATNKTLVFTNAQVSDSGTYFMRATNADKAMVQSNNAVLTVIPPTPDLEITGEPAGANLAAGGSHTMSVTVTGGLSPYTYEWYFNPMTGSPPASGSVIQTVGPTASTTNSLTLSGATYANQGTYSCVITDGDSPNRSATTVAVDVTVLQIQTQPVDVEVGVGSAAAFSVVVRPGSGVTPYSYQWRYKGSNIAGATQASYTVNNCQPGSPDGNPAPVNPSGTEGDYSCVVTDSAAVSVLSSSGTLSVATNPIVVLTHPQGGDKYSGQSHTFSCTASGGVGTLIYQWQKDGANISGATDNTLTLGTLATSDEGDYQCLIGDDTRPPEVPTQEVTLQVRDRVSVTLQPVGAHLTRGGAHTFTMAATGGYQPLSYQWYKGSLGAQPGTGTQVGTDSTSLALSDLAYADQGTYSCLVSDSYQDDEASSGADLTVLQIQRHPSSQEVATGADATFDIQVVSGSGVSPYFYQWRYKGNPIAGATTTILTVANCQPGSPDGNPAPVNPVGDAGDYTCQVTDSSTASLTSDAATLTVAQNPIVFDEQPVGADKYVAGSHTFTCVASGGVGTLIYQWQKDGVDVANATNSTLSLTNLQLTDDADYQCLVGDSTRPPEVPSDTATLQVRERVALTLQPVGANKKVGDNHTFTVTVTGGYSPLTYRWYRGALGGSAGTGIVVREGQGSAFATYTITGLIADQQGGYSCVISDNVSDSETSTSVDLTVLAIQTQPASQEVADGAPATFSVSVRPGSGISPYTYQWQYRGVNIAGATNSSYTVAAAGPGSPDGNPSPVNPAGTEGDYHCIVTDGASVVLESAAAALTVSANPIVFDDQPDGAAKYVGQSHTFSVSVSGGSGTLTYQWQKDGTDLPGATTDTLTLSGLALTDAGDYQCLVGDNVHPPAPLVDSAIAALQVGQALQISSQPDDADLYVGEAFSVSVGVTGGVGTPTFQWYKGFGPITDATDSTLEIASVQLSDDGGYRCFITDDTGGYISSSFGNLEVSELLQITVQPQSATVTEGDAHSFSITTTGGKRVTHYRWLNQGVRVGGDSATYPIASVATSDSGSYVCEVWDSGDPAMELTSDIAFLSVEVPFQIDQQPQGARLYRLNSHTFSVHAKANIGTLAYQWYFDDGAKAPEAIAGATSATYELTLANASHVGAYYATVTDDMLTPGDPSDDETVTSDSAELQVSEHLLITTQLANSRAYIGDSSFSFTIETSGGYLPLTYDWTKDSTALQGASGPSYYIVPVESDSAGSYEVEVADDVADSWTSTATLEVTERVAITTQPVGGLVDAGGTFSFTVAAEGGFAPLHYQWRKGGVAVSGGTDATLVLDGIRRADEGTYTCLVSDDETDSIESAGALLDVNAAMPAAGVAALGILSGICALAGALALRRRD